MRERGVIMAEILEVIMIVSFGASWPLNVIKSYKARTTKGKSLAFLCLIFFWLYCRDNFQAFERVIYDIICVKMVCAFLLCA